MVFVVMFGGSVMLRYWASKDPVDQKPVEGSQPEMSRVVRQVWRVRLWVRLVAVAVPLAGLPLVFSRSCSTRSGPTVRLWGS